MKTTHPQQTSLLALVAIQDLSHRERQVYDAIGRMVSASNLDVAEHLGLPINYITPRTNTLVAKGMVEEDHRGLQPQTNRTVIYWRAVEGGYR